MQGALNSVSSHLFPCPEALTEAVAPHGTEASTETAAAVPNVLNRFEIRPFVFVAEPRSTNKLLMGISNPNVMQITLNATNIANWFANTTLALRDDGLEPDEVASDRIFTCALSLAESPVGSFTGRILRNLTFRVHFADNTTSNVTEDVAYAFATIDRIQSVAVSQVSSNVFKSKNVVNLVDRSLLVGAYPSVNVNAQNAGRIFYRHFPDDFDWLVVLHLYNTRGQPAGSSQGIRNAIQGIGRSLYDNSSSYGSGGTVRGLLQLYFKHTGPMSHEIFHTWGVFGFNAFGMNSSVGGGGHWGALAHLTTATVFGFPPTLRAFSTNSSGNYCGPYGNGRLLGLELYLMGLAPATEIGAYTFVSNSVWVANACGGYEFSGSGLGTLDSNRLIAGFGPRVPAYPDQNIYRAAVLAVSERPLSIAEWNYLTRIFDDHTSRFPADFDGHAQVSYLLEVRFETFRRIADGRFEAMVSAPPGRYRLLRSEHLLDWSDAMALTFTNETVQFTLTESNERPQTFLRLQRIR